MIQEVAEGGHVSKQKGPKLLDRTTSHSKPLQTVDDAQLKTWVQGKDSALGAVKQTELT